MRKLGLYKLRSWVEFFVKELEFLKFFVFKERLEDVILGLGEVREKFFGVFVRVRKIDICNILI